MKKRDCEGWVHGKTIKVLLAEDHATFRKSLKMMLEMVEDIDVIGEAKNGKRAIALNSSLRPDLIIMDIGMPLINGLNATRTIVETSPQTKVLMLSAYPDPEYIRQAITMGACGYLIKQSSAPYLIDAIRQVLDGGTYFSASIPKRLQSECQKIFAGRKSPKKPKAT
jgi:DNA-binding NarL/FixJ family response regulator